MWLRMSLLSALMAASVIGGELEAPRLSYVIPRENDVVALACEGEAVAWILPGGETVTVNREDLGWIRREDGNLIADEFKNVGDDFKTAKKNLEESEPKKRKVAEPQNSADLVLEDSAKIEPSDEDLKHSSGSNSLTDSPLDSAEPQTTMEAMSAALADSTPRESTPEPSDPKTGDMEISSRVLRIRRVSASHRGRYSCERADGLRFHFLIPYVGERFDTAKAVALSVAVSIAFGVAFFSVMLLDRWCRGRTPVVGPGDLVWDEDGFFREPSPRKFGVIYSNAIGYDPPVPPIHQV